VIYQPQAEFNDDIVGHEWIVAVPILLRPGGPSIGVVSLNGNDMTGEAGSCLADLALKRSTGDSTAAEETIQNLVGAINVTFWALCAHHTVLGTSVEVARAALEAHDVNTGGSEDTSG